MLGVPGRDEGGRMSIWISTTHVGHDPDDGLRGGEVRSYADGWSNHYPTTDGEAEQPAFLSLAVIPSWCVPGYEGDEEDALPLGPWLRLDLDAPAALTWWTGVGEAPKPAPIHASAVLDRAAVVQLVGDLTEWLTNAPPEPSEAPRSDETREGA